MMKLAIMQPYFFPYLGYFQLIAAVDKFVIYDDVNYIKRGWVNRNRILINGEPNYVTVPLNKVSQNKLINETYVNTEDRDFAKIKKAIYLAYKNAPHFDEAYTAIEGALQFQDDVAKLNTNIIKHISQYIGINTEIAETSSVYNNIHLKAQERILDICKQEGANHYINPIGGQEIYDRELFENSGIKLNFIKSDLKPYRQFGGEFIPGLSIIDIIMFNNKEEVSLMLNDYSLV